MDVCRFAFYGNHFTLIVAANSFASNSISKHQFCTAIKAKVGVVTKAATPLIVTTDEVEDNVEKLKPVLALPLNLVTVTNGACENNPIGNVIATLTGVLIVGKATVPVPAHTIGTVNSLPMLASLALDFCAPLIIAEVPAPKPEFTTKFFRSRMSDSIDFKTSTKALTQGFILLGALSKGSFLMRSP
jgi:hypothetical protein